MTLRTLIIGAGGQARDTDYLLRDLNHPAPKFEVLGFLVTDLSRLSTRDSPVLGDIGWLDRNAAGVDAFVLGVGTPSVRASLSALLRQRYPSIQWPTLVHPSAQFDTASAQLGRGVVIGPGVIGTVNLSFGDFALVNPGVSLGHEATIGDCCVLNHACGLSGGVTLEEQVLVGTGARVLQYRRVGRGARVGAGAVVTRDVPPDATVVGVPACVQPRRQSGN